MDFDLTEEQEKFIQQVRELCQSEIHPYFTSRNIGESILIYGLSDYYRELNLVCPTIPKEYGGLGLDIFTTALVIEEIAACWRGLAAVIVTNLHAIQPLLLAGSNEQKEKILPCLTVKTLAWQHLPLLKPLVALLNWLYRPMCKNCSGFLVNGSKDYVLNAPASQFYNIICHNRPT